MQKIVWRLGQIIMGYFWGIAFKIDAKMKVSFNDIIGYESQKSDLAKIIRLLELRSTSKCRLRAPSCLLLSIFLENLFSSIFTCCT